MMEPPHVFLLSDDAIITIHLCDEGDHWMAMLMDNPVEWSKVGSSEAEAIGRLVMALDEFKRAKKGNG